MTAPERISLLLALCVIASACDGVMGDLTPPDAGSGGGSPAAGGGSASSGGGWASSGGGSSATGGGSAAAGGSPTDSGTPDSGSPTVTVSVSPKSGSISPGETQTFTCTVTGSSNAACTWSVVEADGGTMSPDGVYTAPASGGTFHVVATSVADPAQSATATIGVVAPCSGLSGTVGTWQNISPPEFSIPNVEAYTIVVNPVDGSLLATAGNVTNPCPQGQTCAAFKSGVLESTDCGAHWSRINDQTANSDGLLLSSGAVWAMIIDSDNPNILYSAVGYGSGQTIHKSIDDGVHWVSLNPDPLQEIDGTFVQAIAMDPHDHSHLAVTFHLGCGPPNGPYHWCFSTSTNGGTDWAVFDGPVSIPFWDIPAAGWVEGASIAVLGPTSYLVTSAEGVWYTADTGATWTLVIAQSAQSAYSGGARPAPDGTLFIPIGVGPLFESAPAPGQSPPFALYQAPTLPLPQPRLPYLSGLSPAVTELNNSPQLSQLIDDGTTIYGSAGDGFWTAALSNPDVWVKMPDSICSGSVCRASAEMAYDSHNHIVYSANWGSGFWRLVTQ